MPLPALGSATREIEDALSHVGGKSLRVGPERALDHLALRALFLGRDVREEALDGWRNADRQLRIALGYRNRLATLAPPGQWTSRLRHLPRRIPQIRIVLQRRQLRRTTVDLNVYML